jgi:O-antigen ligase
MMPPLMKVQAASAWVAALFLASVLFSHTVALRLLLLGLGIALAAFTLVRARGAASALPQVWLPFLLWALWSALSLAWSIEPDRSEKELRNEVIYSGLALWVCYVCAQARAAPRAILPVFAAAAALASAIALYTFSQGLLAYTQGWHGGAGNFSSALTIAVPCALAAGWYSMRAQWPKAIPWLCLGLLLLFLAAAHTTQNRTIWLGFALEIAILLALFAPAHGFAHTRRNLAIGLVVAAALAAAAAAMTWRVQAERLGAGVQARSVEQDPRFAIWPEVLDLIGERPVAGYGFGRGLLRHELPDESGEKIAWHAHNFFLDIALQTGLVGLALFVAILGALLREGWRLARRRDDASIAVGAALIAVVFGMAFRNLTDTLLVRQNALLFWGVAGVLLAWGAGRNARA